MKMARCLLWLTVIVCCSACGAPSLRYKKQVNRMFAAGEFAAAAQHIEKSKNKEYSRHDRLLYYLDSGAALHDAMDYIASDTRLNLAQERIDELFTQSVSAHAAQYLINDLTVPYQPASYERALTYYYRAMNFLSKGDIENAAVEAKRAVYYLDAVRSSKEGADNPFVQYFMSLVFESAGKRDDARISRMRAAQLNNAAVRSLTAATPAPDNWGEVVLVHANGVAPLKKSETFQVAWDHVFLWMNDPMEGETTASPQVRNAIASGLFGHTITLSYPVLEDQPYMIAASEAITAQGKVYPTWLLEDLSADAKAELKSKETATLLRMALRVAAKRVAAVQARHAATNASKEDNIGYLAEMFVNILGAATERADTRQWFTLPAQWRLTRFYVPPGTQDITLRFRNGFGNIVGEYTFKNVVVPAGGRVYLHHRTAK